MSYFRDVYKARGKVWGNTSKDQYLNIAKKYFEDYLLTSPNAGTIAINNIDMVAAVHDNKQDENEISKYFLIGLDYTVTVGNLIEWLGDYWLVIKKEKRNFEAYNKVLAVRCNYTLNWIDTYGVLFSTPCYLFGGMNNRVEDNFRIASGLMVMPQANKNLEIIIPYYPIQSEQRFIIRSEAWRVLERDLISVDGIMYMYLVEDLVDSSDDNTSLSVADYDRLGTGYIDLGLSSLTLGIGNSFSFNPILYKENKVVNNAAFTYSAREEGYYISITNNTVTGLAAGISNLSVASVDQPSLFTNCPITITSASIAKDVLQLVGDDTIKHGRTRTYTVFHNDGGTPTEVDAVFSIANNTNNLVSFVSNTASSYTISANTVGNSGTIVLTATTNVGIVNKSISVVSVW